MSTFGSYWEYCWNHNKYIVEDIRQTLCQGNISIWTGLRKFDIDHCDIDMDSCYIIDIQNQTVYYIKRNCTEHHFFFVNKKLVVNTFQALQLSIVQKTQHHRLLLIKLHGQPKQFLHIKVCLPMPILQVISISLTMHCL